MKLHLTAEDASIFLQDASSRAVTTIPTATRELLRIKVPASHCGLAENRGTQGTLHSWGPGTGVSHLGAGGCGGTPPGVVGLRAVRHRLVCPPLLFGDTRACSGPAFLAREIDTAGPEAACFQLCPQHHSVMGVQPPPAEAGFLHLVLPARSLACSSPLPSLYPFTM